VIDKLYTVAEVAELLGYSTRTVYLLTARGDIPVIRPTGGRTIRIRQRDLQRWLETNREDARNGV
jgi:excisionase family DNA binding protein